MQNSSCCNSVQTQHFIMSPRQHTQLHMVRTRGRQPMELQCHLALHAFSRYYSLWGDWCRNAQFGKEILQSDLYSSRLLKTEQKHLPWWLSLIWQNINLDLVPKKCTSSKTYILSSSRTWCSYRGCQRLSLFHPTQSASIPMLHGAVSIPCHFPYPVLELFWDYMPGEGRKAYLISKHKPTLLTGTHWQWEQTGHKQ